MNVLVLKMSESGASDGSFYLTNINLKDIKQRKSGSGSYLRSWTQRIFGILYMINDLNMCFTIVLARDTSK